MFTNKGTEQRQGQNVYARKEHLLFDRHIEVEHPIAVIGIPRCLNLYEEYPFWHTLLNRCGLRTVLSAPSSFAAYEAKAKLVMSDNICFPAKLAHSHIQDLIDRRVDRIFMPFVVFEKQESGQNSYNCPIVSGYAEVIKSVQRVGVPIDSPTITFKDKDLLYKQCKAYLRTFSIPEKTIRKAFEEALGQKIVVPDNHQTMGAIGAALLAMENHQYSEAETKFKGWEVGDMHFHSITCDCNGCSNNCEVITILEGEGEVPHYDKIKDIKGNIIARWGGTCGRWDIT